jgi:hypothetical protein
MMNGIIACRNDPVYKEAMAKSCKKSWETDKQRHKHASEIKMGVTNPAADKTKYIFVNALTNETFSGYKCDFRRLHSELNLEGIKKIITKKWKHYKHWTVTFGKAE